MTDHDHDLQPVPNHPFPVEVFPPPVAAWLEATATAARLPTSALAWPFLAATGSLIGKGLKLELNSAWIEMGTLWVALVAPTGYGKTPALGFALQPFGILHREAWRAWRAACDDRNRRYYSPTPTFNRLIVTEGGMECLIPALRESTGLLIFRDELYSDALAFCGPGYPYPVPVIDGRTVVRELRADAGRSLFCQFFNFVDDGEKVDPDAGVVRITKFTCPDGVRARYAPNHNDLMYNCQEYVDPVKFSVTSRAGYNESAETTFAGSPALQEAEFTNVPLGEIEITEAVPGGYDRPLVFCTDREFAADGSRDYRPVDVIDGGTIVWDLQTTNMPVLRCLFFNSHDGSSRVGAEVAWSDVSPAAIVAQGPAIWRKHRRPKRSYTYRVASTTNPYERHSEERGSAAVSPAAAAMSPNNVHHA